jgi:hypothetical protein
MYIYAIYYIVSYIIYLYILDVLYLDRYNLFVQIPDKYIIYIIDILYILIIIFLILFLVFKYGYTYTAYYNFFKHIIKI